MMIFDLSTTLKWLKFQSYVSRKVFFYFPLLEKVFCSFREKVLNKVKSELESLLGAAAVKTIK